MKNKELIQKIDLCKKYLSINNNVFNMLKRNLMEDFILSLSESPKKDFDKIRKQAKRIKKDLF